MTITSMCVLYFQPLFVLYISCKQIMYFILIYLTEHTTPKEWSFGVSSEEIDVVIDKKFTELRRG